MHKPVLLLLATLGLAACAQPAQHTYVRDAVSSRLFLYQQPTPEAAVLEVVRANGLFGAGCATQLRIDGQVAAQLQPGERAAFYVPAGQHQLQALHYGTCRAGHTDLAVQLQAGAHQVVQIGAHGQSLQSAGRDPS